MHISVSNLVKSYKSYKKEPGFKGSLKSLFSREYDIKKAVNDISFNIERGELVGFIGPNGAGKTTTLKCLSGLLFPTSGHVSVLGYTPFNRKREFLKQISLVMGQKNQLWWDLPPMETFLLNKEIYEVSHNTFKQTLDELVDLLEIKDILNVSVRKLSLGQRMKCELIAALIHTPKILFLDEPSIGLDVVMQQKLRNFIKEYNKKYNSTILLTSHYMEDVKQLCERVLIIDHGKLLFDGNLSDIVKKYSTHKLVKIEFEEKVSKEQLKEFGEILDYEPYSATISVDREQSSTIASEILKNFSVEDVVIEEESIDNIVRKIFIGKQL